ncbi:MAG: ATP-binding protein [Balneolaceae bacterium]
MDFFKKNKLVLFLSALCVISAGYSLFEWSSYQPNSTESEITELAENSVSNATQNFQQFIYDFTSQSTSVASFVKQNIEQGGTLESISEGIINDYDFWGTIIFKDKERLIWNGFVPDDYAGELLSINESLYVSIETQNNVTYLFSVVPFFIKQDTSEVRYDVYNRVKIAQENILSLGTNLEQHPEEEFSSPEQYPVNFSFNRIVPQGILASSKISTISSDSLGKVYALVSDIEKYERTIDIRKGIWRALFYASLLLLFGLLVFAFAKKIGDLNGLLIQIFAYTCIWLLIKTLYPLLDINSSTIPLLSNLLLVQYIVNSFYTFLIGFSISKFLIEEEEPLTLPSIGILSFFTSVILGSVVLYFLHSTSSLITNSDIVVMDLELLPSSSTLLLYLSSSISLVSLLVLNITNFWFILKNSTTRFWGSLLGLFTGFITSLVIAKASFLPENSYIWILVISTLFFLITLIFALFLLKKTPIFLRSSKLRLLIFVSYLTVCFVYIAYSSGTSERQNQRMLDAAESFSVDEENEIQTITVSLLQDLSNELSQNSERAFDDSFFDEYLENYIKPEWLKYSISVQIIDEDGDRFSDYTTSLSRPQWSTAFRIQELEIPFEVEQIRRQNIRPVIRTTPINTINAKYSTFRRGWIPIFQSKDSNARIGWILCSVYEELPQLDRPLRTVISSSNDLFTGETLTSSEYRNGTYVRSSIKGIPLEIPGPNVLPESIIHQVQSDSIFTTSFHYNKNEIKELYVKKGDNTIVRIAAKKIAFTQHIFSFLRLFFILVILGICIMIMLSGNKKWHIFGYSRRFKDRLVDRFILASIMCLLTLVGTSYFVLNIQNSEDVQTALFEKLDNLIPNLETTSSTLINDPAELQKITSILDVDASVYQDGKLINSTTSQIFSQHLLPSSLPWNVYHRLTTNQSTQELSIVNFDGQQMAIGYKPWLGENNQVAGIAAVPTFLKAPKFYDRLLSTTSLLLAFYTLIFGLLMMVIAFISSQLTSPLEAIQGALKKISDGDLNVTLPVRIDDEIGTLTKSYNSMAKRLKTVQLELAKNEREEAWKEMAQQIAHEIKNPLTPMKLNLQHLERQMKHTDGDMDGVKPKIAKITASMIEQIDALNKIASDFSSFAKPIEHEFNIIDFNDLVRSVAEMYYSNEEFVLITDFSKIPLTISGAKDELRRVLVNLIKNASEALGEDGKITISTFSDQQEEHAFVTITDNGEGIPTEHQDKIFVPNFSTKSSGTGLGLAITKKIIEEHKGDISFISTAGEGTSFTICIPFSGKQAE